MSEEDSRLLFGGDEPDALDAPQQLGRQPRCSNVGGAARSLRAHGSARLTTEHPCEHPPAGLVLGAAP
jgi:hypothetical protein